MNTILIVIVILLFDYLISLIYIYIILECGFESPFTIKLSSDYSKIII